MSISSILAAAASVVRLRQGVRNDELLEARFGDTIERGPGEDSVRDNRQDAFGAVLDKLGCGEVESSAGVSHVVDEDGDFAFDVADEHHARDLVGTLAFFVEERKVELESVGEGGSALGTSSIGRDD